MCGEVSLTHSFACSWDPFPPRLPSPSSISGTVSSFIITSYDTLVDIPGKFMKGNGRE